MNFYVGISEPSHARHFDRAFISINRLRNRRSGFAAWRWILDSGAFTEISTYGDYRYPVEEYALRIRRWVGNGELEIVVAQDWMCEPWILKKTGLTVADHQRLTIERYDRLIACDLPVEIMPVLQGYRPQEYADHVRAYGDRLSVGAWVGVGSVCRRAGNPAEIARVLAAIMEIRSDLRLHGFGVKKAALVDDDVRGNLYSADSMAWSFDAMYEGRDQNDWREAIRFRDDIEAIAARPIEARQIDMRFE